MFLGAPYDCDMSHVHDLLGGPTEVARVVGLSAPTVHGWKRVPEQHCPAIELWKVGQVTVEQLRPDLVWRRIPDADWPHPEGRPLRDFAAATPAKDAAVGQEGLGHG